ncbi:MAG: TfoX/Sxy family protein, partial [Sphingomonadales bacterium]|nr:TfoX/Sxy family protein [Sphingomonadales bacterium]
MGTSPETAAFFREQAGPGITLRKMFGEYAVQAQGKTLGLICDDALFVRQLPEITAVLHDPVAGLPYPGAKPWWRIEPDAWEEADWLRDLL